MKYDVTFTEQAENDLRGIFEYISIFIIINPMRRMRHLVSYVFSLFARHGRALTGVSPEHAQIVGSV